MYSSLDGGKRDQSIIRKLKLTNHIIVNTKMSLHSSLTGLQCLTDRGKGV
jgi:hypothetical protein